MPVGLWLAFEFAPYVRANGVAPGAGDAMARRAPGFVPIGRMPTPAEYAGAYVFFASRETPMCT